MPKLTVNVDHVATLREARKIKEPDPIYAAVLAELAGADGITIHLREDRRHIRDRDLYVLKEIVKSTLNLEMAPIVQMVERALEVKPNLVTLVPERREELTTEGGLDVEGNSEKLNDVISRLKPAGIRVSLFIDPDINQIKAAAKLRAEVIELSTARYAESKTPKETHAELEKLEQMTEMADKLGIEVHAGHGLNYRNIIPLLEIEKITEYAIGHAIVARAVLVGFSQAVQEMVQLIKRGE